MTHAEWYAAVVKIARGYGWQFLHVPNATSQRTRAQARSTRVAGWPDLFLWHERHGFAAIECKVGRDTATPDQARTLASLHAAGAAVMVAYPAEEAAVVAMLRGLG